MTKKTISLSLLIFLSAGGLIWLGNHGAFRSTEPVEQAPNAKHQRAERGPSGKSHANYPLWVASAFEVEKLRAEKHAGSTPEQIGQSMDDLLSLDANELKKVMARAGQAQDRVESQVMHLFLQAALVRLAKHDPHAVLEWLQQNLGRFPDLLDEDGKGSLLFTVAGDNPGLAFQMIEGAGFGDLQANPIQLIASAAATSDVRTTALAALRNHIPTLPEDGMDREMATRVGIYHLVNNTVREGFEPAIEWISASEFAPDELKSVAKGITYSVKSPETGLWIQWMMDNIPNQDVAESTRIMFSQWSRVDDEAAGNWLIHAAESHAKNAAIVGYIETFAYLEPEIIVQWAELLPAGRAKNAAMKRIYEEWPKEDPSARKAAEEFAKKQGLN